jgi:hypothetical protein
MHMQTEKPGLTAYIICPGDRRFQMLGVCDETGITLIGYFRSNKLNVYSQQDNFLLTGEIGDESPAQSFEMGH